jgi:predicted metal-dependent peptidase
VVNQYIERSQLPDDSIFLDAFPDLHLEPGQTWFYYYKKMEDLREGASGEFAGTPSAENLQKIKSDSHGLERHQPWQEIRSRSELEKSVVDNHLDSLLRTAHQRTSAHAWGSLPGDVRELLQGRLQRAAPTLHWPTVLRRFAGSASRTRLHNTIRRPSRRYGTVPGIKIKRRQRLLVVLDTSGSIGADDLEAFFGELFHLWRAGAEIDVVECDTRITNRYAYKGRTPEAVQGRGGTDFNEPLELANTEHPDAVVYFTDGFADTVRVKPRVPVLWLITRQGLPQGHAAWTALPGRKVKMSG